MSVKFRINANELIFEKNKISFDYSIRYIEEVDSTLIVLLGIPYNEKYIDNVFGVSNTGEVIWRIENVGDVFQIKNQLPFENLLTKGNDVFVSDFYGRRFSVNPNNGKILSSDIVR